MDLVIQLISGAVGGMGAGKAMPKFSLGMLGNIVAGVAGGGVGSQLLSSVMGGSAAGMGADAGSMITSIAGSGIGGSILMVVVGLIKNAVTGPKKAS